jgi:hypothetical protein
MVRRAIRIHAQKVRRNIEAFMDINAALPRYLRPLSIS